MDIYYCYLSSPVGRLLLLSQQEKLMRLDFEREQVSLPENWIFDQNQLLFLQVARALARYFSGEQEDFARIPLKLNGSPFQIAVWQGLSAVKYGEVLSYAQLAKQIGRPQAVRAVGGAVGRNPISIILPCHRILAKDGALTGFGGGLPVKRYLLQLEGIAYQDRGIEFVKPKVNYIDRTL